MPDGSVRAVNNYQPDPAAIQALLRDAILIHRPGTPLDGVQAVELLPSDEQLIQRQTEAAVRPVAYQIYIEENGKKDAALMVVSLIPIPGAGIAADVYILADPDEAVSAKLLAAASIVLNIATLDAAPNFGAVAKASVRQAGAFRLLPFVHNVPEKLAGAKITALFEEVALDPRFLRIAKVDAEQMRAAVKSASIRYANPLQGGFAGRVTSESGEELILALSRFHARRSPAAHELFHLARDLRGVQTLRLQDLPGWRGRLREELAVWQMQFRYAPIRTALEGSGHITIYLVPAGGTYLVG